MMRHSTHSRFVPLGNSDNLNSQPTNNSNNNNTHHSFQPHPATLATHRNISDPYSSHTHQFYYAQLFSQQHPDLFQPYPVSHLSGRYAEILHQEANRSAYLHTEQPNYLKVPPTTRRPLAGLGISFDPPMSVSLPKEDADPPRPMDSMQDAMPVSMPLRITELQYPPSEDPLHARSGLVDGYHDHLAGPSDTFLGEYPPDVRTVDMLMHLEQYAYSNSPSSEYIAHTPSSFLVPTDVDQDHSEFMKVTDDFLGEEHDTLVLEDIIMTSPSQSSIHDKDTMMSTPKDTPEGPIIGLFPDINLRHLAAERRSPSIGINPSCIMGSPPGIKIEEDYEMDEEESTIVLQYPPKSRGSSPISDMTTEFPEDAVSAIFDVLSASLKRDPTPPLTTEFPVSAMVSPMRPLAPSPPPAQAPTQFIVPTTSGMQGLPLPPLPTRSSNNSPSLISGISNGLVLKEYRSPLTDITHHEQNKPCSVPPDPKSPPTSPVLNAHLGIELDELRRKATEYRARHLGKDIDKTWLQDFAGRLSERGELLADYRCYVVGCAQRNKRRDHILVHVGSHVEYRPFECEHW